MCKQHHIMHNNEYLIYSYSFLFSDGSELNVSREILSHGDLLFWQVEVQ